MSAPRSLADRVAIVTGASGGIGRGACLALARAGARVAAVGRDRERVETTAAAIRELGADALPLADVDVRVPERVDRMVATVLDRWHRVDVLVVAAGVGPMGGGGAKVPCGVSRLSVATWDEVIDTNLGGTYLVNRAVIAPMIAAGGGDIVNVASARGSTSGRAYASAYCASKFGVVGLSQALADEVRPHGIRVQVFLPDAVDTPLVRGSTLTRGGALPAAMVGEFIVDMLGRPRDAALLEPILAPFGAAS